MNLLSVNVGKARPIDNSGKSGKTGIYKQPTQESVRITTLGLNGDTIVNKRHHGGVDQAVYLYGGGDYAWWATELGRPLEPGTFGENLTIVDLESAACRVGDRLRIGEVILEVTAPRIPCATLAAKMGDPTFAQRFQGAERPGLYCRVIQEGVVRAGDPVIVEPYAGDTVTILEMFRDFYRKSLDEPTLRRYLAAPIAIRYRTYKEQQLAKLLT